MHRCRSARLRHRCGPTIAVYNRNADDPSRVAELDAALDELARRATSADGLTTWEYLLVTATVR